MALGRIEVIDERDKNYPVSGMLAETSTQDRPFFPKRTWWDDGWWGNQGPNPFCVTYAWNHFLEDGPVIQDGFERASKPYYEPKAFYDLCQVHDQWEGTSYDGTSVRAGAKILKKLGVIKSYLWASNIEDVVNTVKYLGPVVVGTRWYANMSNPTSSGRIDLGGGIQGGHAYVINGCDDDTGLLRIKNSWGRNWGVDGHAYISYPNFETLLLNGGEACIAFENKMDNIPELLFS